MSSGFVSGGTSDAPIERDAAWLAAQQELEATRRRKAEENRPSDGRGLFETLQANKAAKEDAFAEASRLKNQFRALDADEAEFLDSVLERTRQEEDEIKAQTREGLEAFRKRQEELDLKARALEVVEDREDEKGGEKELSFSVKGKRKRGKEKEGLRGVKRRKSSGVGGDGEATEKKAAEDEKKEIGHTGKKSEGLPGSKLIEEKGIGKSVAEKMEVKPTLTKGALGLVDYGSDDDDDW